MTDIDKKIGEILARGVNKIIKKDSLEKKLKSGKILRIKHGVDPTTSDLHLGYAVAYRKLKQLQDLGHTIVFLIGDFTGRFGDPTDKKDSSRKMRGKEEVKELAGNYINQLGKILNIDKVEIRYNGEWYDKMSAENLIKLMSKFSARRMLERDMFQERDKNGLEISLHEPVYPVLQGYDSVMLESDLTVIGNDQEFNELQGRRIQEIEGQDPQDLIIVPLLIGTDGKQKMSQSLNNYIGITEEPNSMFGKVMSISDTSIANYFELCTDVPMDEIKKMEEDMKAEKKNPRDLKLQLAEEIVKIYHGKKEAEKAKEYFVKTISNKEIPEDIKEIFVDQDFKRLVEFLVMSGNASSLSDARRKIEQGGVEIDGKKEKNWQRILNKKDSGSTLKIGKHGFAKIKF
ncbi:tyrosine--tRNA ligase [Patescibacteria group bacterium]